MRLIAAPSVPMMKRSFHSEFLPLWVLAGDSLGGATRLFLSLFVSLSFFACDDVRRTKSAGDNRYGFALFTSPSVESIDIVSVEFDIDNAVFKFAGREDVDKIRDKLNGRLLRGTDKEVIEHGGYAKRAQVGQIRIVDKVDQVHVFRLLRSNSLETLYCVPITLDDGGDTLLYFSAELSGLGLR